MLVPINKDGTKKAKKDYSQADKDYLASAEEHDKGVRVRRAMYRKQQEAVAAELGIK
jgi:hypothetical protein